MLLLPAPKRANFFTRKRYAIAALLDLILIITIILNGIQPAQRLISPLVNSFQNMAQAKMTEETFSFVPGAAPNKFSKIEFEGLKYLNFFDVPITDEGELNFDSTGYDAFKSERVNGLFEEAHFNNTKVLLTITATGSSIRNLLDDSAAQKKLIEQAIEEVKASSIDGVTIDFEFKGDISSSYRDKFSKFIDNMGSSFKDEDPAWQVAVTIPSSASKDSLYDLKKLSKSADKVFLMAYDVAVPEVMGQTPKSPVYGYSSDEYWKKVGGAIGSFLKDVPAEKLVMERAWYGNGDNYPLYTPNFDAPEEEEKEPAHVFLDSEAVDNLVASVPAKARDAARKNIPLIGKALEDEGILDSNVLAYALATIEHETAETFEPLEEYGGRFSARRLGYEGGTNYFGRGFIQLTHLRNYKVMGHRIGLGDELVKHPELAGTPEVAAKILAAFFKDNNIANLASRGNFVAARVPVNPDRYGYTVASLAWKYGLD